MECISRRTRAPFATSQKHLDWYEEMLRRQFSNMDGSVSGSNAQTDYLSAIMNLK